VHKYKKHNLETQPAPNPTGIRFTFLTSHLLQMGKRKAKAKRSAGSLPKGLPVKGMAGDGNEYSSLFEGRANKRLKQEVLNRNLPGAKRTSTSKTTARAFQSRQGALKQALEQQKSANKFKDQRLGEGKNSFAQEVDREDVMLRRLMKERAMRSKRTAKYDLHDDNQVQITHGGKAIDESYTGTRDGLLMASDDEDGLDDDGYAAALSKSDTELHFGGGKSAKNTNSNPYGPASIQGISLGDAYRTKKQDLDDMIARRKENKVLKLQQKEDQLDTFEKLDDQFAELSQLLSWGKKKNEKSIEEERQEKKNQDQDAKDMDAWNIQVKELLFERKVQATDRTKSPEEIAAEKAQELHELERKRIARMNGHFEKDDLSDLDSTTSEEQSPQSPNPNTKSNKNTKKSTSQSKTPVILSSDRNPDELDDDEISHDGSEQHYETKFTSEGLVYLDSQGHIVGKVADSVQEDTDEQSCDDEDVHVESHDTESEKTDKDSQSWDSNSQSSSDTSAEQKDQIESLDQSHQESAIHPLPVGTKVMAYGINQQMNGVPAWYHGTVKDAYQDPKTGNTLYNIDYDYGDFEDGVEMQNVRVRHVPKEEAEKDAERRAQAQKLKRKKQKAKEMARYVIVSKTHPTRMLLALALYGVSKNARHLYR